jgi:hypothetical protein
MQNIKAYATIPVLYDLAKLHRLLLLCSILETIHFATSHASFEAIAPKMEDF